MKKRTLLSLAAAVTMLAVVLTACKTSGAPAVSATPPMESASASAISAAPTEANTQSTWFKKYDPPITLTTYASAGAGTVFHEGDSVENNGLTRWEETLGIKWKFNWIAPDSATSTQKLDLAFASGTLPDVIHVSSERLSKYVAGGQIMPLDDLIGTYASPLVKWALEDAQEQTMNTLYLPFTFDGKLYAFPRFCDSLYFWTVNYIRDDILKEMNMRVPSTLDELDTAFEAYHAKYPEGVAFGLDNTLQQMYMVMSAYEAYPQSWIKGKDGKVVYGSIQPEVRAGLEKLSAWYQKGYIDSEFVVKDESKVEQDMANGKIFSYYGYWHYIGALVAMWKNDPDSNMAVMPYLTGPDGKTGIAKKTWFPSGHCITASCKNPEAVLYLLNQTWDSFYRNEKELRSTLSKDYGYEFMYPETESQLPYNVDEISQKYPDLIEPSQLWSFKYSDEVQGPGFLNDMYLYWPGNNHGFCATPVTLANNDFGSLSKCVRSGSMDVLTYQGKQFYDQWYNTHPKMLTTFADIYDYWDTLGKSDIVHPEAFAGAPTPTMVEKQTYLQKIELETFTAIIMGTSPITAFDQFVKDWNDNGGQQITNEVNEWYAQLK